MEESREVRRPGAQAICGPEGHSESKDEEEDEEDENTIQVASVEQLVTAELVNPVCAEVVEPAERLKRLLLLGGASFLLLVIVVAVTVSILRPPPDPLTLPPTLPPEPLDWHQLGQTLHGNKINMCHYFGHSVDLIPNGTVSKLSQTHPIDEHHHPCSPVLASNLPRSGSWVQSILRQFQLCRSLQAS